jgi:ABC-type branched-subunit amino acid transport system substrate-binding protein
MFRPAAERHGSALSRRPALLFGLGLVLLALTACGRAEARRSDPVVKIGLVAPFEGRYRDIGYDVIYSARLAVREANEASEPGQTKVMLVAVDDFGDADSARQFARAMVVDPDVVAVIGHWLPETTAAAAPIYAAAGLAFVPTGEGMFGPSDPGSLPRSFLRSYEEVTPFDEVAGQYAGSAYDGMGLILAALGEIEATGARIDRSGVLQTLPGVTYEGITGTFRVE